jgi:5-methylcytosine-specific restriction endonuclease McrA
MRILKIIKHIRSAKNQHFISVSNDDWKKWSLLIRFIVWMNPNYKSCVIYRKKYKHLINFVVVGLKWNGKNVKRRTTGFAKDFVNNNRNSKCVYCETKLTLQNATADHIIPISEGGNNSQINLMVCCFDCNNQRGNTEFVEYLREKNPKYKNSKIPFV